MFYELENKCQIVKLEVLQCSDKIVELQNTLKPLFKIKTVFKIEMNNKFIIEQGQQDEDKKKHFIAQTVLESHYSDVETSRNRAFKPSNDFSKTDIRLNFTLDLDQSF